MGEKNVDSNNVDLNEIGSELWIYTGNKDPFIISTITGIPATTLRKKGDPWINSKTGKFILGRYYEENIWILNNEISYVDEKDVYLNHSLSNLLKIISTKSDEFKSVFFNDDYISLIRLYGYYYDYHIYFRFEKELISMISDYNLVLDFDLYSFKKTE